MTRRHRRRIVAGPHGAILGGQLKEQAALSGDVAAAGPGNQ